MAQSHKARAIALTLVQCCLLFSLLILPSLLCCFTFFLVCNMFDKFFPLCLSCSPAPPVMWESMAVHNTALSRGPDTLGGGGQSAAAFWQSALSTLGGGARSVRGALLALKW